MATGREDRREAHEHPHLEGQDEDDARNGGNADEPAPPDGGDDHRGQANDEQGANQPEDLQGEWKMECPLTCAHASSPRSRPSSVSPQREGEMEQGLSPRGWGLSSTPNTTSTT